MHDDPYCNAWLGREETRREVIGIAAVAGLAATLDWARTPGEGEPLPAGWQWLFFNPVAHHSQLGEDGHPRRTSDSFLPPIALPRRMWAGSRIQYLAPLVVGDEAVRSSRIERIVPKEGQSGRMCFVTVVHRTASQGRDCIVEHQDIVYREASTPSTAAASAAPTSTPTATVQAAWQRTVLPDPVLLFRYSALTFNGHRIHYDAPYAREVEHYSDLVVHGPLTATLLQALAVESRPGRRLTHFEFKGMQPLFVDQPIVLCADRADDGALQLKAVAPSGSTAMQAIARFANGG